jgi:hypothetical protein
MKKIFSVVAIVLIAGSAVFASEKPEAKATVTRDGSMYKVLYARGEQSDVKISIYDASGKLIFLERLRKVSAFSRPYDFSDLPQGEYTIEINDGSSVVRKNLNYRDESHPLLSKLAPVAGTKNKYLLTVSNKEKQALFIRIYDEQNNLKYSEKTEVDGDFAKVYALNRFDGNVWFEIVDSKGNASILHN